ncbi:uncharacterized protein LOC125767978 [Anopheles funestus]|uniref:uncharacterized protein LOC125767978 n=1 Tax=Anopheles funestus TaxID=62324 RepID=UPI0020C6DAFB|nr:uncharacterized protein LOC125767978 [Anopheles funestus]
MVLYRFVVGCLLLLAVTETKVAGTYFEVAPSAYCPIPLNVVDEKSVVRADLHATCNQRRQEGEEKIKQAVEAIRTHIMKQVDATDPIRDEMNKFTAGLPALLHTPKLKHSYSELEELRTRVLIAAIEAGRTSEALTQYLILAAWDRLQDIVDRIYQNTRCHPQHIENLLGFIRALPARQERLEFYRYLKKRMVEQKDYESYLGAMFAQDARSVVFDADGKTALNDSDVAALYTTMIDGAVGFFRNALLTGAKRLDLILLDRNYPELFDMLFEKMFNLTATDMGKWNSWKMMEALCAVDRPMSKVRMFQKTGYLLVNQFKWPKQNEFYAPMLAGYFDSCLPEIKAEPTTKDLINEVQNIFTKFKPRANYQSILKMMGKDVHAFAG